MTTDKAPEYTAPDRIFIKPGVGGFLALVELGFMPHPDAIEYVRANLPLPAPDDETIEAMCRAAYPDAWNANDAILQLNHPDNKGEAWKAGQLAAMRRAVDKLEKK